MVLPIDPMAGKQSLLALDQERGEPCVDASRCITRRSRPKTFNLWRRRFGGATRPMPGCEGRFWQSSWPKSPPSGTLKPLADSESTSSSSISGGNGGRRRISG